MKIVVLPLHPFSRRILLSEYGSVEPVSIRPNDILFSMLSLTRVRDRSKQIRVRDLLTTEITFQLDNAIANHLALRCDQVGLHLFKWHKDQLCRYVDVCLRRGGITAAGAIREFYNIHSITEDDFAETNAWKVWQRHNAETQGKNRVFSGRIRGATAVVFSKKTGRPCKVPLPVSDETIEDMAERLTDVVSGCLRRVPKSLHKHARCYLYLHVARRGNTDISRRLAAPISTIYYGASVIRNWQATDPTFRRLLQQVCALPEK